MPPSAATSCPDAAPLVAANGDSRLLTAARGQGRIAAELFKGGEFSEPGFLLYGRLEALCRRGLLAFESWNGDPMRGDGDVRATFTPV